MHDAAKTMNKALLADPLILLWNKTIIARAKKRMATLVRARSPVLKKASCDIKKKEARKA